MRHITIVGAGQAGLQLALSLLQHDYRVTLLTNRTPAQLRTGPILSTQGMFASSLDIERGLGLDFWQHEGPKIESIEVNVVGPDGSRALSWQGSFDRPGQSTDQRMKFAHWLELFQERGGELVYGEVTPGDLAEYARRTDLVLVAAGKGAIAQLFPRNPAASPYDAPQRILAVAAVHGASTATEPHTVGFTILPGAGEYIGIPALTLTSTLR